MWETIKKTLQKGGGRCIIVENGQPVYVVMSMKDYDNLLDAGQYEDRDKNTEQANRDIEEWKLSEGQEPDIEDVIPPKEEVKVEDLPF